MVPEHFIDYKFKKNFVYGVNIFRVISITGYVYIGGTLDVSPRFKWKFMLLTRFVFGLIVLFVCCIGFERL